MNQKAFNKLVKSTQQSVHIEPLTQFLKKAFPNMTIKQGCAIWWLLANRDLIVDGKDISGSFRYNGGCIANCIPKTTYLHFYCSYPQSHWKHKVNKNHRFTEKFALRQYEVIKKHGGKLKNLYGEPPLEEYFKHKTLKDWAVIWYYKTTGKVYTKYRRWKVQKSLR